MTPDRDLFSPADPPWRPTLQQRADTWIKTHPQAMALFEKFALEILATGERFGIALLAERVRWQCRIEQRKGDDWKINNSYRAYIARYLIAKFPQLGDVLETRKIG